MEARQDLRQLPESAFLGGRKAPGALPIYDAEGYLGRAESWGFCGWILMGIDGINKPWDKYIYIYQYHMEVS